MGNKAGRQKAEQFGRKAEFWAKLFLRLQGYQILEERYKTKFGEIDLVAKRGKTLVFVEVKARRDEAALFEALEGVKRDRIGTASQLWLAKHPQFYDRTIRFDVIGLEPLRWPVHIVDAFQAD